MRSEVKVKTHKVEPVDLLIVPDELVDITILHPR